VSKIEELFKLINESVRVKLFDATRYEHTLVCDIHTESDFYQRIINEDDRFLVLIRCLSRFGEVVFTNRKEVNNDEG
jgi:hypothetical protein